MMQHDVQGASRTQLSGQAPETRRAVWASRLSRWSFLLAFTALAAAAAGVLLARYDLIAKMAGFSALLGGAIVSVPALLLAIGALLAGRGQSSAGWRKPALALLLSALFVGFAASRVLASGGAPAIHDATTDPANPPQFEVLTLRPDNLAGVGTEENWRRIHAAAYGDLAPVRLELPVAQATARIARLAQDRGWQIAITDPARGHVEATAAVSFIRFYDDVVLRAEPVDSGAATLVDMRSVSRIGIGDLGVNARRIRAFMADLAAE